MKVTVKVKKEVEITTLQLKAGVRYWEDGEVNGVDDEKGDLIPFRDGDYWIPVIDIDKGQVIDWPTGTKARVHYKICDDGSYFLKDAEGKIMLKIQRDYVPEILCPEEEGYGDYIIMNIDENGFINNWKPVIKGFK